MQRTNRERAESLREEAVRLLREKPVNSTMIERHILLDQARAEMEGLPQPLFQGRGLSWVIRRVSLPIDERDFLLGRYIDRVPTEEEENIFQDIFRERHPSQNPILTHNNGHITLDWETLVSDGIIGYIRRAESKLAKSTDDTERIFYEGMTEVYRAVQTYIIRYAEVADKAGKDDCAEICRKNAYYAPATFREALQLVLFVYTVYTIYAGNQAGCLTLGRMDQYLERFYLSDLADGTLTEEDVDCLLDDFYSKTNLHLGRGEHQMANAACGGNTTGWERNPAFDSPTYIILGGYTSTEKKTPSNQLTLKMIERLDPLYKNPVIVYRHTAKDPEEVWMTLCDKARRNAPVLIYNDETMIPAMINAGVYPDDAVQYSIHACNWPDVAGGYAVVDTMGGPIPRLLTDVLDEKRDFKDVDAIYRALSERFRADVKQHFSRYRMQYRAGDLPPSSIMTATDCFLRGPLDKGRHIAWGGAKYPVIYTLLRNIGTAADMMAAIEQVVFIEKICTLKELCTAVDNNFAGANELLARCCHAPKYGTDDDTADCHAVRLMKELLDVIDEESVNENGVRDVISMNVTITDMRHIEEGAALKATADGRLAGAPLSENLSPSVGYSESMTSLLHSVAKLPFDRIHSGAFNLRLRRDLVDGDDGLRRLAILGDTYFEEGGMQLQISVADTAELRAAQQNPEQYRDLTVRITGYSAVFVDMSKNAQDEIIRRDELGA